MSDNQPPAEPAEGDVSSNYTPKGYEIAPEDRALADSLTSFDPLYDVAGPVSSDVALKAPASFTRDMLPPDMIERVDARLLSFPPAARTPDAEQRLIREALEQNAYAIRVMGGPGPDADAYKQEWFLIEHERHTATSRLWQLEADLMAVDGWDAVEDEKTGQTIPKPIPALKGNARTIAENEAAELRQRLAVLEGGEGKRRLDKALHDAVQHRKKMEDAMAIEGEAKALGAKLDRDSRVAEKAASYRKWQAMER